MHFFKLSRKLFEKFEPETSAYFEEIGLNKQILFFELIEMKSSFSKFLIAFEDKLLKMDLYKSRYLQYVYFIIDDLELFIIQFG